MTSEEVLSVPDAAEYLGVATTTMYRLIDRQRVPYFSTPIGGRLRIRIVDLDRLKLQLRGEDS